MWSRSWKSSAFRVWSGSQRGRRDQEVDRAPPGLAATCHNGGVDPPVRPRVITVERHGLHPRFKLLQPILTSRPFGGLVGGVRPSRQFGHRDRADRCLIGQIGWFNDIQVDHHRRVEQASLRLSYEG